MENSWDKFVFKENREECCVRRCFERQGWDEIIAVVEKWENMKEMREREKRMEACTIEGSTNS